MENSKKFLDTISVTELPVLRNKYLNQDQTNTWCSLIFESSSEKILGLAQIAHLPHIDRRNFGFGKMNHDLCWNIRQLEKTIGFKPMSKTSLVDLLFEIDRRLRWVRGGEEISVFGDPIAESPIGPFPTLIPYHSCKNDSEKPCSKAEELELDQRCLDLYNMILKIDAECIFAYCEAARRQLEGSEANWCISNFVRNHQRAKEISRPKSASRELGRRIHLMTLRN